MKHNPLKLVEAVPPLEDEIRLLLIQRNQAIQALAWADAELLPLRKRYAGRTRGIHAPKP